MTPRERLRRRAKPRPLSGGLGRFRWLLPPLIAVALAGFTATAAIHVIATLRPGEPWSLLGFLSFPGIFPVWAAAVLEGRRIGTTRTTEAVWGERFQWSHAFRGLRRWEAVTATIVTAALVLLTIARPFAPEASDSHEMGAYPIASLVPMAFFGSAALLLLSAWRIPPDPEHVRDEKHDGDRRPGRSQFRGL